MIGRVAILPPKELGSIITLSFPSRLAWVVTMALLTLVWFTRAEIDDDEKNDYRSHSWVILDVHIWGVVHWRSQGSASDWSTCALAYWVEQTDADVVRLYENLYYLILRCSALHSHALQPSPLSLTDADRSTSIPHDSPWRSYHLSSRSLLQTLSLAT